MSAQRLAGTLAAGRPARGFVLSAHQTHWLAALLVAVEVPLLPFLPAWVGLFGLLLVGLRLLFLRRDRARGEGESRPASPWLLLVAAVVAGVAIRFHFGYFAGRDPCVAFLVVLLGIKFLEARTSRDGALLVCLSGFLTVALFFYSQSLLAGVAVLPALLLIAAALLQLTVPPRRAGGLDAWRAVLGTAARMLAQGLPLALLLFVFFPRLTAPLWGLPTDHTAKTGLSDRMAPGLISELSLSDAVAFRVDFDAAPPPPAAALLARPRVLGLRRRASGPGGTAAARPLRERQRSSRSPTRSRWSRTTSSGCSRSTSRSRRRCSPPMTGRIFRRRRSPR